MCLGHQLSDFSFLFCFHVLLQGGAAAAKVARRQLLQVSVVILGRKLHHLS